MVVANTENKQTKENQNDKKQEEEDHNASFE